MRCSDLVDTCVQGEVLLPFPLVDEFIVKVKDAVGHILSWPRHLVIRCSDLEKMTRKPMIKGAKHVNEEEFESKKETKRKRELNEENKKLKGNEKLLEKEKVLEKETGAKVRAKVRPKVKPRRRTRGQLATRVRVESSRVLKMAACMVDSKDRKQVATKVQCEDDLFGYESFTYISWEDFEVVFTLHELTGSVITCYIMYLYEQVKNGPKKDYGVCFVSPSSISDDGRGEKFIKGDDASRSIANRLSTREDNNIILMPYNPGGHWVLAVLDMETTTCYYLDSLNVSQLHVNSQLKHIIETAMVLYSTTQIGSNKRVKINWISVLCSRQPGIIECGYYVLRFMKEVIEGGLEVLKNNNIGSGKSQYTEADIDDVREEWTSFVMNFVV